MAAKDRQKNWRDKLRKEGLVEVRGDIPSSLRDRLRTLATQNNTTMKQELVVAIEKHVGE